MASVWLSVPHLIFIPFGGAFTLSLLEERSFPTSVWVVLHPLPLGWWRFLLLPYNLNFGAFQYGDIHIYTYIYLFAAPPKGNRTETAPRRGRREDAAPPKGRRRNTAAPLQRGGGCAPSHCPFGGVDAFLLFVPYWCILFLCAGVLIPTGASRLGALSCLPFSVQLHLSLHILWATYC